jgi:hypothetical protein
MEAFHNRSIHTQTPISANNAFAGDPEAGAIHCTGMPPDPEATRLTHDQARELKRIVQAAFGYQEGERRLRADLGFEVDGVCSGYV